MMDILVVLASIFSVLSESSHAERILATPCAAEAGVTSNLKDLERIARRGSVGEPSRFVGHWCATEDNLQFPADEITINPDGSMFSVDATRRVTWAYVENTRNDMIAASMQTRTDKKGTRDQPGKTNGLSVLFELSPNDELIWTGPIKTSEFPKVTPANLSEHLLKDAREYKMTWKRCEALGS